MTIKNSLHINVSKVLHSKNNSSATFTGKDALGKHLYCLFLPNFPDRVFRRIKDEWVQYPQYEAQMILNTVLATKDDPKTPWFGIEQDVYKLIIEQEKYTKREEHLVLL